MDRILIGESEILVGRGIPEPLLPPSVRRRRVAVLTQPGAEPTARQVADLLSSEIAHVLFHVFPDREEAKGLPAVTEVYGLLAANELGRSDTIVAVGGGAVTDAAGFVAGTWMRGVDLVNVPTTLLGAVDASIGGKTAVNLAGKNLVGVFWPPRRVVVDLSLLERLPIELKREGAAEVIKAGLLAAPEVVDLYVEHGLEVPTDRVVTDAIRVKAAIVSNDLTEQGDRALLNLGHTIGHAVEYASGLSHGEAVAVGLIAAAAISEKRFGFERTGLIRDALKAADLPTVSPPIERRRVLELVGRDKKRQGETIRMVLLEDVGRPRLVDVDESDLAVGLDAIGL